MKTFKTKGGTYIYDFEHLILHDGAGDPIGILMDIGGIIYRNYGMIADDYECEKTVQDAYKAYQTYLLEKYLLGGSSNE